jgi:hypothetical protein
MSAQQPVAQVRKVADGVTHLFLWCPACTRFGEPGGDLHQIVIEGSDYRWEWDGNLDAPTISPSLLVRGGWSDESTICHSFIKGGQWQFLGDCTHAMAGQTVPLPPLPDWFLDRPDY